MAHDPLELPATLPTPVDDGGCDHLVGMSMPHTRLTSTTGGVCDIGDVSGGPTVVYIYPRTGRPGVEMPEGWDTIPGARGCTPQSCAYRDGYSAFREIGVAVYGLSTQTTEAQREFAARERIPFPLLSDPDAKVGKMLRLPTFLADNDNLYKRVTLVIESGIIVHVRYPVFPPNSDAAEALTWLRSRGLDSGHAPPGANPLPNRQRTARRW